MAMPKTRKQIISYKLEEMLQCAHLGLGDDLSHIITPVSLRPTTQMDIERPDIFLLNYMRNPENFYWTVLKLFNKKLSIFQIAILKELWNRPYPMLVGTRGMSKTWLLALYSMLRAFFKQGSKIVIAGAVFRQSKMVFEYCERFWEDSEIIQEICNSFGGREQGPKSAIDKVTLRIGESTITGIPVGDGTKIRGLRATTVIVDEFAAHSEQIFEQVLTGFGLVTADPSRNVEQVAKVKLLRRLGVDYNDEEETAKRANQLIISGTAYYEFNHFAKYWKKYKAIIESRGDRRKLQELNALDERFDWRDFSIIRMPVEALPEGFMDEKNVGRSKVSFHESIFQMEMGAIFVKDSQGFFKRTLIESCVCKPPINLGHGPIEFSARLRGVPGQKYYIGVDPASESDRFSIVVLESHADHGRIVYCWTTTNENHKERMAKGLPVEGDFYGFCARKIRDLMKLFPCDRVGIDSQGGGVAIREALSDKDKLKDGEVPFWPIRVDGDPKPTDGFAGNHCIEFINFSDAKWTSEANHGMKKDFEDKVLLFPYFDNLSLGLAYEEDKLAYEAGDKSRLYDSLDDCVSEIEELKDELATIVMTQTGIIGRDRWDTPDIKLPGGKKGKMRKDRYSALIIANMITRQNRREIPMPTHDVLGIYVSSNNKSSTGSLYRGDERFSGLSTDWVGRVVNRNI